MAEQLPIEKEGRQYVQTLLVFQNDIVEIFQIISLNNKRRAASVKVYSMSMML